MEANKVIHEIYLALQDNNPDQNLVVFQEYINSEFYIEFLGYKLVGVRKRLNRRLHVKIFDPNQVTYQEFREGKSGLSVAKTVSECQKAMGRFWKEKERADRYMAAFVLATKAVDATTIPDGVNLTPGVRRAGDDYEPAIGLDMNLSLSELTQTLQAIARRPESADEIQAAWNSGTEAAAKEASTGQPIQKSDNIWWRRGYQFTWYGIRALSAEDGVERLAKMLDYFSSESAGKKPVRPKDASQPRNDVISER